MICVPTSVTRQRSFFESGLKKNPMITRSRGISTCKKTILTQESKQKQGMGYTVGAFQFHWTTKKKHVLQRNAQPDEERNISSNTVNNNSNSDSQAATLAIATVTATSAIANNSKSNNNSRSSKNTTKKKKNIAQHLLDETIQPRMTPHSSREATLRHTSLSSHSITTPEKTRHILRSSTLSTNQASCPARSAPYCQSIVTRVDPEQPPLRKTKNMPGMVVQYAARRRTQLPIARVS